MLNPNIEIKKWFYNKLTAETYLTVYEEFCTISNDL